MTADEEELFSDFYENIGMCYCGTPEKVQMFLFQLLTNLKAYKDIEYNHKLHDNIVVDAHKRMVANRRKIISETDPDVIFEFVFHVLDSADIIGHGSSIYSSWLEDKGEKFLQLLATKVAENEQEDVELNKKHNL